MPTGARVLLALALFACTDPPPAESPPVHAEPPPSVPVTATAWLEVRVDRPEGGAEVPWTAFTVRASDVQGLPIGEIADHRVEGVCRSQVVDGALAAWRCGPEAGATEVRVRVDEAGLALLVAGSPVQTVALPVGAAVTWENAGPTEVIPVRLRFEPVGERTHLTVEGYRDAEVIVRGEVDVDGVCKPAPSPPAGREDGNLYLQCDRAADATFVKLVERDRKAVVTQRLTTQKPADEQVLWELPPPDGYLFDL